MKFNIVIVSIFLLIPSFCLSETIDYTTIKGLSWKTASDGSAAYVSVNEIIASGKVYKNILIVFEEENHCAPVLSLVMLNSMNYGITRGHKPLPKGVVQVSVDGTTIYDNLSVLVQYDNGFEIGSLVSEHAIEAMANGEKLKFQFKLSEKESYTYIYPLMNSGKTIRMAKKSCLVL